MPRNGSGVYSKPAGTTAVANATIESAKYNSTIDDLVTDANAARPITAGGTGATSAAAALVNLGADGKVVYAAKSGNYTAVATDNNAIIRFTAAATLSLTAAATLGSGWHMTVSASTSDVTIDPNSSELIDGAATLVLTAGTSRFIYCDGSAFYTTSASSAANLYNYLLNGDGRINQGSVTSAADDVYAWDQHYALTQTGSVGTTTTSATADNIPYMMRMTQSQASAQRMGNAQPLENIETLKLRGKTVTLGGRLRCSSAQAIRFAILEWTGTADILISDVVNDWTNGVYTTGNFFNSTALAVASVGSITPTANAVTSWSLTGTVSTSANNLIVMYWTEGPAAQNVTLDMVWHLVEGDASGVASPALQRNNAEELLLCKRFFVSTTMNAASGFVLSGTGPVISLPLHPEMLTTPVPAIVTTFEILDGAGGTGTVTSVASNLSNLDAIRFAPGLTGGAGFGTAGRPVAVNASTVGLVTASARL